MAKSTPVWSLGVFTLVDGSVYAKAHRYCLIFPSNVEKKQDF